MFPKAKIKSISGQKFYEIYRAVQMIKPGENEDARKDRFEKLQREFRNINLLIITNLEELENKIKTQTFILDLMKRENLKVIFSSNKNVEEFPNQYEVKQKEQITIK
jgi:chromosomal replication initiation ATPase DnaA